MSDVLYSKLRIKTPQISIGKTATVTSEGGSSKQVQIANHITDMMLPGMEKYNVQVGLSDENVSLGYGDIKNVITEDVNNLTVDSQPKKKIYAVGEALDLTGVQVTAIIKNGNEETFNRNVTNIADVTPPNGTTLATEGTITITFEYYGQTVTINVEAFLHFYIKTSCIQSTQCDQKHLHPAIYDGDFYLHYGSHYTTSDDSTDNCWESSTFVKYDHSSDNKSWRNISKAGRSGIDFNCLKGFAHIPTKRIYFMGGHYLERSWTPSGESYDSYHHFSYSVHYYDIENNSWGSKSIWSGYDTSYYKEFYPGYTIMYHNDFYVFGYDYSRWFYSNSYSKGIQKLSIGDTATATHVWSYVGDIPTNTKYDYSTYMSYSPVLVVYNDLIHGFGSPYSNCHFTHNGSSATKIGTLPYDCYGGDAAVLNNKIYYIPTKIKVSAGWVDNGSSYTQNLLYVLIYNGTTWTYKTFNLTEGVFKNCRRIYNSGGTYSTQNFHYYFFRRISMITYGKDIYIFGYHYNYAQYLYDTSTSSGTKSSLQVIQFDGDTFKLPDPPSNSGY